MPATSSSHCCPCVNSQGFCHCSRAPQVDPGYESEYKSDDSTVPRCLLAALHPDAPPEDLFDDPTLPRTDPHGNDIGDDLQKVQAMTTVPRGSGLGWRRKRGSGDGAEYKQATCDHFGEGFLKWIPGKQMTAHCGVRSHGGPHNCRLRRQLNRIEGVTPPHKGRPMGLLLAWLRRAIVGTHRCSSRLYHWRMHTLIDWHERKAAREWGKRQAGLADAFRAERPKDPGEDSEPDGI